MVSIVIMLVLKVAKVKRMIQLEHMPCQQDIVKDCDLDQKAFMNALLALPPLALETLSMDATPKVGLRNSSNTQHSYAGNNQR